MTHSSVATISASAEERAVRDCLLEIQCMGPWPHRMNPERDLVLKSSKYCGGVLGLGLLWSWGPQLASVMAIGCFGGGNLMNAASLEFPLVENVIPLVNVPLM